MTAVAADGDCYGIRQSHWLSIHCGADQPVGLMSRLLNHAEIEPQICLSGKAYLSADKPLDMRR